MSRFEFSAILERPGIAGAWTQLPVPIDISKELGRGQIKVKGNINGVTFRSTLLPRGDGSHDLVVARPLREQLQVAAGSEVQVVIELDTDPRTVEVPDDLRRALDSRDGAGALFDKLAPSHKKEFIEWIESAKRPETRARRIAQAVEMIAGGKRLKG